MSYEANRKKWRDAYSAKLRDPRWQKMRLEILNRDEWTCAICGDNETTLNVHHRWYERGKEPWESPAEALVTLCEVCHEQETEGRAECESEMLTSLKRRYFAFELHQISKLMTHMQKCHVMEVQLTAIAWFLSHRMNVEAICEAYFDRGCPQPGESP